MRAGAARFRGELIPLTSKFSYFSTLPIAEEDLRHYLGDPIAAISPAVIAVLPQMGILLAPFLEKGAGKEGDLVVGRIGGAAGQAAFAVAINSTSGV